MEAIFPLICSLLRHFLNSSIIAPSQRKSKIMRNEVHEKEEGDLETFLEIFKYQRFRIRGPSVALEEPRIDKNDTGRCKNFLVISK